MGRKILLIEDDLDIQRIYSEKLKLKNYAVLLASDAGAGMQLAKSESPNLILLDVMLPGKMNGMEALEQFKKDENLKNIPVVVMTNLDTEKQSALKVGAADYLLKADLNLEGLVKMVEKYAK